MPFMLGLITMYIPFPHLCCYVRQNNCKKYDSSICNWIRVLHKCHELKKHPHWLFSILITVQTSRVYHFVGKISLLLVRCCTSSRMPSAGHQVTRTWHLAAVGCRAFRQQYKWQVRAAWNTATHLKCSYRSLSTVAHRWMDTPTFKKILPEGFP
jgi:hypothetical protein